MSSTPTSGGIGLAGILTIIFVLAKLFRVVTWSWFWVFSPIIITTGVAIVIIVIVLAIVILVETFSH